MPFLFKRNMLQYVVPATRKGWGNKRGPTMFISAENRGGAVNKSAERILYTFSEEEKDFICRFAQEHADSLGKNEIEIQEMHNIVEGALWRE